MKRSLLLAATLLLAGTAQAQQFRLPLPSCSGGGCSPSQSGTLPACFITAYVDHGGTRDWNCQGNTYAGHDGTDFGVNNPGSRDVVSGAAGVVLSVNNNCPEPGYVGDACGGGFGNYVFLDHSSYRTIYGHMVKSSVGVNPGTAVGCGAALGKVGNSGNSTGPHLHFGVYNKASNGPLDPFFGSCSSGDSLWTSQAGYCQLPSEQCSSVCIPQCFGKRCGDGGCPGASCGTCADGATCGTGGLCQGEDKAQLVSQSQTPAGPYQSAGISFTQTWVIKNTGTSTWTPGDFRLEWEGGDSLGVTTGTIALAGNVAPGSTVELTKQMLTPGPDGRFAAWWSMVHNGTRFGPAFVTTVVVDKPSLYDNADFVRESSPYDDTVMQPGQSFTKSWTFKNNGNTTWETDYKLAWVGGDALGASPTDVSLGSSEQVPPGAEKTFTLSMRAPTQPGTYTGYWRLSKADARFGEYAWLTIVVAGADGGTPVPPRADGGTVGEGEGETVPTGCGCGLPGAGGVASGLLAGLLGLGLSTRRRRT